MYTALVPRARRPAALAPRARPCSARLPSALALPALSLPGAGRSEARPRRTAPRLRGGRRGGNKSSGRDNADEEQVRLELGCPTHTHTLGGDLQNKSKAKHSRAQKSQGQDVNLLVLAVLPFVCRS